MGDSKGCGSNDTDPVDVSGNKIMANRANGRKSKGPKSPAGKAVSSRNATRHGLLAASPVLPGLESERVWQRHLHEFFRVYTPVGYCEQFCVTQMANISWRLGRIGRFEAQVAADSIAATAQDLENIESGSCKPQRPAFLIARVVTSQVINLLEKLPRLSKDQKIDKLIADVVLFSLCLQLPAKTVPVDVPGIPNDEDELAEFDGWTVGLLRTAVEHYAAAAGIKASELVERCLEATCKRQAQAEEEEYELAESEKRQKLEREKHRRMLLKPEVLDKVTRYESHLQRSLFKWLHELNALQALRLSRTVSSSIPT